MTKYLLVAAGVLVLVVVGILVGPGVAARFSPKPAPDPVLERLAGLADLAEQTCLVGTDRKSTAEVSSQIELIKGVKAGAGAERRETVLKGAIDFPEKLKAPEMAAARACLEPWAEQMRDIARLAMAAPAPAGV
jgi:hypothetical protein